MAKAAVLGGSLAGLAAGIALARRGWDVVVVERDRGPDSLEPETVFTDWARPHVPQFRQPHALFARTRRELEAHLPDAIGQLADFGIAVVNPFKRAAPPEMWTAEDDDYGMFFARRSAIELVLRQLAERQSGLVLAAPATAVGLLAERSQRRLRVTGLRLGDGAEVAADVVVDAGGRRSPVRRWLAEMGTHVAIQVQDCAMTYHSRHYRTRSRSSPPGGGPSAVELDRLTILSFTGDNDTFAVAALVSPDLADLDALRHEWAFDAAIRAVPGIRDLVDVEAATPLTPVATMSGHKNVLVGYRVGDEALVDGLLPVGDALCTTSPEHGWGVSMALSHAFAAAASAAEYPTDPRACAERYLFETAADVAASFEESAAKDRIRLYRWRGEPVPEHDRANADRHELLEAVFRGALEHPALGRAVLRRMSLLDGWNNTLDDPVVLERAQRIRLRGGGPSPAVTSAEVVDTIRSVRPA